MNLFGSQDLPEPELSDQKIAAVLVEIRRNARNRRLAMIAPVALAAAVLGAFVAAPHRHGGLALLPDADASAAQLPRVFGANGVWRLAEPIGEARAATVGPAAVVEAPVEPAAPSYVLVPPSEEDLKSLPVSASTPPTPTPGQSSDELGSEETDWSQYSPVIIIAGRQVAASETVAATSAEEVVPGPNAAEEAVEQTTSTPGSSTTVEETITPQLSSADEDVNVAETQPLEQAGDAADSSASDTGGFGEANPSTLPAGPIDTESQLSSELATIVPRSVLVHSAHVSVTVKVVDGDSSVIDWCNTRVDWGDGSVTGVTDADGVATCAAVCEFAATPPVIGIDREIVFTHDYQSVIAAAPRIFVATGDGCNYTLAELQLNPFAVVPY